MLSNELVSIDSKFSELVALREAKFEHALTCLISGKTPRSDFKDGILPTRKIRGGDEVEYIPGWWFQNQLNALFGANWSFPILERHIYFEINQIVVSGELWLTLPDGTIKKIPGTGGAEIDRYASDQHKHDRQGHELPEILHKKGDIIDLADDIKSAETEALSRAARWLGFGGNVYNRRDKA